MNPIDEKLFHSYCAPILLDAENFDESALESLLGQFSLSDDARFKLVDALFDRYTQWSLDAFAVGLHLGLSLHGDVRRRGPQQVQ